MSLHLFLNDEVHAAVVKALGGIMPQKAVPFNGINVRLDADGRVYYEVKNEKGPWETMIPLPLKGYVECVSWWVSLSDSCPTRTVGRYEHETAEAIVDYHPENAEYRTARINGPEIERVYELYYQIRSGTARLVEFWEVASADGQAADRESPQSHTIKLAASGRFACPSCQAKFTLGTVEKYVDRGSIVFRCRKCGTHILLDMSGLKTKPSDGKPAGQLRLCKPDSGKSN